MASKILETIFWQKARHHKFLAFCQKAKPERKYGAGHEEGPYTIQNTGNVSKMIKLLQRWTIQKGKVTSEKNIGALSYAGSISKDSF